MNAEAVLLIHHPIECRVGVVGIHLGAEAEAHSTRERETGETREEALKNRERREGEK